MFSIDAQQFKDQFEKAQQINASVSSAAPKADTEGTDAPPAEEKKEDAPAEEKKEDAPAEEAKPEEPKSEETKTEEEKKED